MSTKRFFGFLEFSTWVKTMLDTVTLALTGKLDKSGKALDSSRLDGVTKENLIIEVLATANLDSKLDVTGQAADSAKLGGSNRAAVVSEARAGLVAKSDDFGQYKVGATELSVLLGALASGETLGTLQSAFNAFVAAKATDLEATTGTDDTKYLTAKAANAAIQAAVAELAGTAPEALNTITELAEALSNNPEIITELTTLIGTKLSAVQVQAIVDAAKDQLDLDILAASELAATKLNSDAQAADSALLEGVDKAGVIAETLAAANLGNVASANIFYSTVDPTPSDGVDGDLWITYVP